MKMSFKILVFSFALLLMQATVAVATKNKYEWSYGIHGILGVPGTPGRDGARGQKGDVGSAGPIGPKGESGNKGPKGEPGVKGSDGLDLRTTSNWKQCAWKRADGKDNGLIQNCFFNKMHDSTSLRVFYGGNLRIRNCNECCKRWYFTFDGAECSKPMAIDGVFYMWKGAGTQNIHRHRHIEGYCNEVSKGHVKVGFWVGNCAGYGNYADAYSGWKSVSRIVIEEVPPPQV